PVAIKKALEHLDSQAAHPRMRAGISKVRGKPASFSWCDCLQAGQMLLRQLSVDHGGRAQADQMVAQLAKIGGEMVSTLESTDDGFVARSHSPYGNIYLTLSATFFLRTRLQAITGGFAGSSKDASERYKYLLHDISAAQRRHRDDRTTNADGDQKGEFADLD